jgi:hypothetical protein
MDTLLRCNQCGAEEPGSSHGTLMNKIKMWNHLKREHPMLAERIIKTHDIMPTSFYSHIRINEDGLLRNMSPRWA